MSSPSNMSEQFRVVVSLSRKERSDDDSKQNIIIIPRFNIPSDSKHDLISPRLDVPFESKLRQFRIPRW